MTIFDPRGSEYSRDAYQRQEARKAYTTAILHEALVKFGITDGKLDPKRLRESSGAIAEYTEKRLIGEIGSSDNNPFAPNVDALNSMNGYDRSKFMLTNMAFDRAALSTSIRDNGLSSVTILNRHIPTLFRVEEHVHNAAKMYDFDPSNLDPVVGHLQDQYGIVLGDSLKKDPARLRNLLEQDRDGELSRRSLEEMADVVVPEGGVIMPSPADRRALGI